MEQIMPSDLDTIAINDMKHDLCDQNPCRECAHFRYTVRNHDTALGTYYGSQLLETQALNFARQIARSVKNANVIVDVYDQHDNQAEVSCYYEVSANGNYKKVG